MEQAKRRNGEGNSERLRIDDLEVIKLIVETKIKEMKVVDKTMGDKLKAEQEHKAVQRVIGDLIQILLGYIDPQDAAPLFKSFYGIEASAIQD